MANRINYSKRVIRQSISSRGGGVEISLDTLGFKGVKMTAYQNYLGGGMLGSIANSCTIRDWYNDKKLVKIAEGLRKYYFNLAFPDYGEGDEVFIAMQERPVSAY